MNESERSEAIARDKSARTQRPTAAQLHELGRWTAWCRVKFLLHWPCIDQPPITDEREEHRWCGKWTEQRWAPAAAAVAKAHGSTFARGIGAHDQAESDTREAFVRLMKGLTTPAQAALELRQVRLVRNGPTGVRSWFEALLKQMPAPPSEDPVNVSILMQTHALHDRYSADADARASLDDHLDARPLHAPAPRRRAPRDRIAPDVEQRGTDGKRAK
ncbi:MAG: hypothetical protein IT454_13735 [Planctomycetes bacterium]|nr:hypothetical protein [Planctomycetota bacterium]